MDHLYRYRSLKSLFDHKELENLSIYFAKPEQLNDQMEKYMNVVWQGDEIAFQGLFKHYIYTLTHLYFAARLKDPKTQIDVENLPVFLDIEVLEAPEMKDVFKAIYDEFFSSPSIAKFPVQMATSKKKFTSDEILWIFRSINLYAYLVVDTVVRTQMCGQDVFKDFELKEVYDSLKNWVGYAQVLDILTNNKYSAQEVDKQKMFFVTEQQSYQHYLNKVMFKDKNTHNLSILTFDFPEVYIKNITKVLYNKHCVACFSGTCQNEPMWAHYADNENGICLEYRVTNINGSPCLRLYSVVRTNPTSDPAKWQVLTGAHWETILPVVYSDEYPEIDFFTSLGMLPMPIIRGFWLCNYDKTQFSSCLKDYHPIEQWRQRYHENSKKHICAKATNWSYEKEYRLFHQDLLTPTSEKPEDRIANYTVEDLESITFGRKVSAEDKRKIIDIISGHCKTKQHVVKFYDLYYSTITKCLERKPSMEALIMRIQQPQ